MTYLIELTRVVLGGTKWDLVNQKGSNWFHKSEGTSNSELLSVTCVVRKRLSRCQERLPFYNIVLELSK